MNRLHFSITCPRCGGSLAWVNGASKSSMESVAVMACVSCRAEFLVSVHMVDMGGERRRERHDRERLERVNA